MKTIKGPGIFLAQYAGDEAPFNSLGGMVYWVAGLGFTGVQIPTWDRRLFDLKLAAESQSYCDEVLGVVGLCCAVAGRWAAADRVAESMYPASFGIYLTHPLVTTSVVAVAVRVLAPEALLYGWNLAWLWAAVLAVSWQQIEAQTWRFKLRPRCLER